MHSDDGESIRVLLVAADPPAERPVSRALTDERAALDVRVESSPSAALDRLESVDCVVSGMRLESMDGLQFLDAVRDVDPDVPFILAPENGSENVASEAISRGVTDYVHRGEGPRDEILANRIVNATNQYHAERRATELERITTVLKDIDAALVRAETRADIEQAVCDIIADSSMYRFAWVGDYDADAHSLDPTAWAGIEDGFLELIPVGEGQRLPDEGPGPRAIETGELQVTQDVESSAAFEPYQEAVDDRGFRSVATLPLAHEGEIFGLLAMYADRVNAFDDEERELLSAIGEDIGHAIAAVEARAELNRFREAVDHAGHAMCLLSEDGVIEYANPAFEEQTGYSASEIVGQKLATIQDVEPEAVTTSTESIGREMRWKREFVAVRKSGDRYHAEQTIAPIMTEQDALDGFVVVQADTTGRHEREEALRTETEMLNSVLETSPTGIVVLTVDGGIERANPRAADILEVPIGSLEERTFDDPRWTFLDESGAPLTDAAHPFIQLVETGAPIYDREVRLSRPHAEPIWVSINGAPQFDADGDIERLVFTFDDVTEQKERERQLRSFREAVEHAAHCMYMTDVDGVIEYVNPAFEAQTGYPREEAIGETPDILNSGVHDDDFFAEMWETVLAGGVWQHEIINQRKDGTLVHVDQSIAPVLDEDGDVERFVAINQDVTDRKEYEQRLEEQNERLEEFASVVSHDLRNPLNVAAGHLSLLETDDDRTEYVQRALNRMEAIIDDVLTLTKHGNSVDETERVAIDDIARRSWAHVESDQATLTVEDDISIQADPARLQRIFENLFRNAIEHGGAAVSVTVGKTPTGFYVADDGSGISGSVRERVFESGYSTTDEGTGLGLSIVRRLAQAHGWSVEVGSSDAGGARFEFHTATACGHNGS